MVPAVTIWCRQEGTDVRWRLPTQCLLWPHFGKVEPAETVGGKIYDLGNGQWDIPLLREFLEEVLPKETSLRDFKVQHTFEQIGRRTLLLNARRIDHLQLILLAMEDVTEHEENETLRAAKAVAEESNRAKSQFMANMSHEIRTPMMVFLAGIELLLTTALRPWVST